MKSHYLQSALEQFNYYKNLAEKAMEQLSSEQFFWQYNTGSNSVAVIIRHLSGNMISRWTDFLHSDGEKEWRDRDAEFNNAVVSREEVMNTWERGWKCLLDAVGSLQEEDLNKSVYIRKQEHSVIQAINRQLAHYAYHVGQIVYIAKMEANDQWKSLTIARGMSADYNRDKFGSPLQ
jgi:hypothetical protein